MIKKKEKSCLLIDTAIPNDLNIITKETEKLSKYKDLEIQFSGIWKARTKNVPFIIGESGTIKKG
jgi:hypothetical protein